MVQAKNSGSKGWPKGQRRTVNMPKGYHVSNKTGQPVKNRGKRKPGRSL